MADLPVGEDDPAREVSRTEFDGFLHWLFKFEYLAAPAPTEAYFCKCPVGAHRAGSS
ncbi:hypothetical protein [Phenylobacterium montanum]|uniref:Uncharacterized protein n=1 Tax=Phenylobacterium montanum TaxID=2823693 RepID=A0A975FW33_9CAUL|nr:hypothetical protein [Caulobacter sp. S6]QUD86211.1 hypothetical protein KCG34_13995 [Caulobacter sp. S6]